MLHPMSDEQREIVNAMSDHNVIVDAVAGSGKTTTILHIAKTYADQRILVLTYNSKLRLETQYRAEQFLAHGYIIRIIHFYYGWFNKPAF